jgi:cobalt-zinc-cadmium efflux system protein
MPLKVGDTAPDFELPAVEGERHLKIKLSDFRGKKNVVVSFHPLDWTPTCAAQVPAFDADRDKFAGLDALTRRKGRDVNLRSAFLHEIGDTLSTAAVIAGGWAILATGQSWIDSALSFGIGALILWSGFGIVRETLNILLEGTPRGIKLERVEAAIREIEGVNDVHDLHVWNLGSETRALSCHISIADIPPSASERILRDVKGCLHSEFRIDHTTIQFEHAVCEVAHGCVIPVTEQH